MGADIRPLKPHNSLGNIPHMLRNLASELESGAEPMPRTLLLIAIADGNTPPDIFQFGADTSRLEEVGALTCCINRALQTED